MQDSDAVVLDRLPVIDLTGFDLDAERRRAIAAHIGAACRMHGFFYVAGHGIAPTLLERLEALSRRNAERRRAEPSSRPPLDESPLQQHPRP